MDEECGIPELGRVCAKFSGQLRAQTPSLTSAHLREAQSGCICERALIKTRFPFSVVICIR